ncbi:MAG TPA: acetyl-CoA C-acyltransferase [Acidimicrobiales bacterium]|nr:acetyl-CoA C-acyltransferase [Acidimicrobiales bacterium]
MASDLPVIAAALRTPIGEVHGALSACHPAELLASVLVALTERTATLARQVDQLIVGCAMPVGAQSDIGRAAVLAADWPDTIPAESLAQHSSSSMAALLRAAHAVRSGAAEVVVAAGVEVMSLVPMGATAMARHAYGKPWGDRVAARYASVGGLLPDDVRADELARLHSIERGAQDAWAQRSHSYARAAIARTAAQLVTIDTGFTRFDRDERCTREIGDLAELSPMFDEGGSVTAANRAAIADGAVAIVVTTRTRAVSLGMTPLCSIRSGGAAARGPRDIEPASVAAAARALANAAVTVADLDRIELHEGHAASVLRVIEQCAFAVDRVNPDGGSLALGHPTGATGGRLITALAHAVSTRDTVGLAVVEGEDTALATVLGG